jgi:hypothetical protein
MGLSRLCSCNSLIRVPEKDSNPGNFCLTAGPSS